MRGEEHIGFNRLREDSESVNMIASCDLVHHPSYEKTGFDVSRVSETSERVGSRCKGLDQGLG